MDAGGGEARDEGCQGGEAQPGERLTLFQVGPHGPQLTLGPDLPDHDEQRMFPRVPAGRRQRGSGLARGIGGIRRPGTRLHGNAARPPWSSLDLHGNPVGARPAASAAGRERARLLKAGGGGRSLAAAYQAGSSHWLPPLRGRSLGAPRRSHLALSAVSVPQRVVEAALASSPGRSPQGAHEEIWAEMRARRD